MRKAASLLAASMRLPSVRGGARPRLLSSSTTSAFSPNPPRPQTAATATKASSFPFVFSMASPSSSITSPRLLLQPPPPLAPHFVALFSSATLSPSHSGPRRGKESVETEGEEWIVEWEEEEEAEPMIGDGGDGGGIVLGDVGWGERALLVAHEVLQLHFGDDMVIFAFKVSPRGYIYVRLDKLTNRYGCPAMEEIENFSSLYKKRLDEIVECGEIPLDLALEVSSPGAERLLKVPEDLDRFKEMPMSVQYLEENLGSKHYQQIDRVFMLESIESDTAHCMWKLADVKENRAEAGKGRPLSRKQKDWRLRLPFEAIKRVKLYLN